MEQIYANDVGIFKFQLIGGHEEDILVVNMFLKKSFEKSPFICHYILPKKYDFTEERKINLAYLTFEQYIKYAICELDNKKKEYAKYFKCDFDIL